MSRGRITMTEVRVHAAFSVEDEDLFLSEAKKMILATQVSPWVRTLFLIFL